MIDSRGRHPDMNTYSPTDVDLQSNYIISKFKTLGSTKMVTDSPRRTCGMPLEFSSTCSKQA